MRRSWSVKLIWCTTPPGRTSLRWTIVESIPIPDDVKRLGAGKPGLRLAWISSLQAVGKAGIQTICYNFMPVVDWTRTHLEWEYPMVRAHCGFSHLHFVNLFILARPDAEADYYANGDCCRASDIRGHCERLSMVA